MAHRGGVLLALLFSCGAPKAPPAGALYTAADLVRLKRAGASAPGLDGIALSGQTLRLLSPPFAATNMQQRADSDGLTVFAAFSEGKTAAYLTTEIWDHFPAVWVQPLYVPVQSYDASGPKLYPNADVVFGVGASSRFYSPFWQIFYFVTDQPTGVYHSAKQILDAGFALVPGPGKVCAIAPDNLGAVQPQGAPDGARPVRPVTFEAVGKPGAGLAWVDGRQVWYIDFGLNRFRWDEHQVVDQAALFAFTRADGMQLDLPTVGGIGPLRSGRPLEAPGGKPQFGALWHLYTVQLPPSAGVFVPSTRPALRAYVESQGIPDPLPSSAAEARADVDQYVLRVALNPLACFQDPSFASCKWLDSQAAIESLVPDWRIRDAQMFASGPLLLFNTKALDP